MNKIFLYSEIHKADLIVDAIYEGGRNGNAGDDPISKIFHVGNQGGFRYSGMNNKPKYLILYSNC